MARQIITSEFVIRMVLISADVGLSQQCLFRCFTVNYHWVSQFLVSESVSEPVRQTSERVSEWVSETDEWVSECVSECVNESVNGWVNERVSVYRRVLIKLCRLDWKGQTCTYTEAELCRFCAYMSSKIRHADTVVHYTDVIMSAMASQITSVSIVLSTVCSGADQRKHQSSVSLAFVKAIHRSTVNSPHKGTVTRKMLPFNDVIMDSNRNVRF